MKTIFNLLFFFLLVNITAQSKFNTTSYDVTKGDLETKVFSKDSTANALVIYEKGNSYIDKETFKLVTEIERKVKILNKEGMDHTNVEIYLYNNDNKSRVEKIKKVKGITYNLDNGNISKMFLSSKNIFKQVYNKNNTIVKFTLPKIKEGSVITYSYTIESPFIYKYYGWDFQEEIPKLYSQYNTSIPGNYEYNIKLAGDLKLFKSEKKLKKKCLYAANGASADCTDAEYIMKNIPAFIEEDYMSAKMNYLSRMEYELKIFKGFDGTIDKVTKTWKDTDREIKSYPSIGKQLNKSSLVKKLIDKSEISKLSKLDKAKTIYDYVQDNYTWNEKYWTYKDAAIKDLIKNKSGNVSQINLLLYNLLIDNGIDAKILLLSTRDNGFPTKLFPVISDFNYLIIQVTIDDKAYQIDATDKYLVFGQLPFRCLNGYGRLFDFKKISRWKDIINADHSTIQHHVKLNFVDEDEIKGEINSRYTGHFALNKKKKYLSNTDSYVDDFENKHDDLEVENHEVKSKGINDEVFQETFKITYTDLESTGDMLYFDPFIYKFFTSNPFKLQERTYPIEFGYKRTYMYSFELDLGDIYEVKEVPKGFITKLPNNAGTLKFAIDLAENKITMMFNIDFGEARYAPEYYSYLKVFMSKIVNAQTKTLLVLKKK